jgi:hypothetical protein
MLINKAIHYLSTNCPALLLKIKEIFNENTPNYLYVKDGVQYEHYIDAYDFIIYADEHIPYYKKIIYENNNDNNNDNNNNKKLNKSIIRFILIEFKVEDKVYKIDLLVNNKFNYYFIDNKFTKEFFLFYVKSWEDPNFVIKDNVNCGIKIIDHNVNTVEFEFNDKNNAILLLADSYKII